MTMANPRSDRIARPFRLLFAKRAWKRLFNETRIRFRQDKAIRQFDPKTTRLIVFLVPGADKNTGAERISGGVISITSLCEESAQLGEIHQAAVIMCTLPNEYPLFRHRQFANKTDVFRFAQLRRYFTGLKEVLFHIPELGCSYFLEYLSAKDRQWIKGLEKVHINIMNQNVLMMPPVEEIGKLKQLAQTLTITTAHQRYCNPHYRELYGIPLHKFSVWISPEKYYFSKYGEKENLMVISPDRHPIKQQVLDRLAAIPGLQLQIIKDLTYEQYKSTISRAKWSLTFGEGLDGYIIEPVFSGAIGFAVYNEAFFTPDFASLPAIYPSYDDLLDNIEKDIASFDKATAYATRQQAQFDLCAKYYSFSEYKDNILRFYKKEYTFK
jgi:hypothetical protein